MYMSITRAIPETMAENRKTIGISGVDHQGLALTEPKMKPTYPWSRNAEGTPMIVMRRASFSSISRERGEMVSTPRLMTLYRSRSTPLVERARSTISSR